MERVVHYYCTDQEADEAEQPTAAKTKPKAVALALVFCPGIDRQAERKRTRSPARPLLWGRVDRDAPPAAPTM